MNEQDARRYRYLKKVMEVPDAMQSFLRYNNFVPTTFEGGIDEAIDQAIAKVKE